MDWNSEFIEEVKSLAAEAGKEILKVYEDENLFNVELKEDKSPLTEADKRSNAIICDGLSKLDHLYPIVSEENKEVVYKDRKDYHRYWLIDPLDGTKEFVKRNGEFTVNIALIESGSPVFGVVYVPVSGDMYWGLKGKGAFRQNGANFAQLNAREFTYADEGLRIVCSRSHLNTETQEFIQKLDKPEKVAKGSSLKFLVIAEGGAELYPRLAPTMEWDTGAAHIILEEAGGQVINVESNQPLNYNKPNLLNPHFIAMGALR